MKKLGELIKEKREEKGFSIQDAAELISISRMTLVRIEDNRTKHISVDLLIRISNILEIDLYKMISSFGRIN